MTATSTLSFTLTSRAAPLYRAPLALLTAALFLLCAVVIIIGVYTFVPYLLEGLVARNLRDGLELAEAPEVNLVSDPAPNVLLGRFEKGEVILTDPELGGVRPDQVTVDLETFDLNVPGSVASGRIQSEGPLSGILRVELSEEEVGRLVDSSEALTTPVSSVRLEEGYLVVGFEVEALGARIPAGVEGEVVLRDGRELSFEPSRLEVLGEPLPERLTEKLLEGVDFAYPVDLPFEGEISGIEIREDRLVLTGEARNLPIG